MNRLTTIVLRALALALVASACSDDGDDDPAIRDPAQAADAALDDADAEFNPDVTGDGTTTTSTSTTTTSTTTTIPGISVSEYTLTIDDCFDRVETLRAGRPHIETTKIPCTEPHGFQIFSRITYPGDQGVDYPGEDIVEDFALASCYQRFEDWADSVYETSVLEIRAFFPDRGEFEDQNARAIQCYVERNDGEPLVGTARSSGL